MQVDGDLDRGRGDHLETVRRNANPVGTVSGFVQDPQQQAIVQVVMTIRAPSSGWQQTTETGVDGRFIFQAVPTGDYVISAAKD